MPAPCRARLTEPQAEHSSGIGFTCPQWWHASRSTWRWTTSETSQSGQLHASPQERQDRNGAQPRRLSSRIALPPPSPAAGSRAPRGFEGGAARRGDHRRACRGRPRAAALPRRPAAAARAAPARASSRVAGSRCRPGRRRRSAPRAPARRRARRSEGRPPACRRRRAPRRRRSGRAEHRREDGGAGTDADARLALAHSTPLVVALAGESSEWSSATRSPNRRGTWTSSAG